MATNVTLNGVVYAIPAEGDSGWGTVVQNYLVALSTSTFQKSGGSFALTAETNFGANFGLKSIYYKSQATNSSSAGVLRLGNAEGIGWRNAANNGDLTLSVDAVDNLNFNGSSLSIGGTPVQTQISVTDSSTINLTLALNDITANIIAGSIDNSHISGTAAIGYSKLALSGSIVNSDIGAAAAISYSKLALTNSIVNADISSSAAIALNKLAPLTASRALASGVGGVIEAATTTFAELNYLSGVTSAVQTQLDAAQSAIATKQATIVATTSADYYRGDKTFQPLNKAAVGLSAVDNTSDADKNAAAVTLTNKTLTSPVINGGSVNSATLATPVADVISLTNQASTPASPASGTHKAYVKTSTGKLTILDSTGLETTVGSGSGGGVQNFVVNGDAEGGVMYTITNAITPAKTRPNFDGTFGTTLLSITTTTTAPLAGTKSYLISKASGNGQGSYIQANFTIEAKDKAKSLTIGLETQLVSGTFQVGSSTQDSDLIVYIFDRTNVRFIEPSSIKILSNSTTLSTPFAATFQSSSDSVDYAVFFWVATTNTAAWSMKVDNIAVSPSVYVYGTPVTDWVSYSPVVGAVTTAPTWGAGATATAKWRRVGDSIEISYSFYQTSAGTTGSGTYLYPLPAGLTMDTTKVTTNPNIVNTGGTMPGSSVGHGFLSNTSTNNGQSQSLAYVVPYNSTSLSLIYDVGAFAMSPHGSAGFAGNNPALYISFNAKVPIQGWSSSVQMSDSTDTRVVAAKYTGFVAAAASPSAPFQWGVKVQDTTSAVTTGSAWKFTAQTPGTYVVSVTGNHGATSNVYVYKNGVITNTLLGSFNSTANSSGYGTIELNAGDYIDTRPSNSSTTAAVTEAAISIFKLSGPSAIAASESVGITVSRNAVQSIPTGTTTNIFFDVIEDSTHGGFDLVAGEWTAPISGTYIVDLQAALNYGSTSYADVFIWVNGVAKRVGRTYNPNSGNAQVARVFWRGKILAGQKVKGTIYHQIGSAINMVPDSLHNAMSIQRVGN